MGKRHSRSDSWKLHDRHLIRVRQSVDSHLRLYLGKSLDPDIQDPFPVSLNEVREYLRKVADREHATPELSEEDH